MTGPVFHYSDTWQLIINTGTTIITFLMVFLIQNTQNRDGAAVQTKLDELIRVTKPGGRLCFSVARTYLEGLFDPKRKELEDAGLWRHVDETGIYNSAPLGDHLPSRVYCFEVC